MRLPPLPMFETPGPPVQLLSDRRAQGVLRLTVLLGQLDIWPGPVFHAVLAAWLESGPPDEGSLPDWCREHLSAFARLAGIKAPRGNAWRAERFEQAERTAEEWWHRGLRVYSWGEAGGPPRGAPAAVCPRVLFGRGNLPAGRPWVALFNSRKPRELRPEDRWLAALRPVLAELARLPVSFAGSCGTLTYDLVTAFAQGRGLPLVLVSSDPLGEGLVSAGCARTDEDLPAGEIRAGRLTCAIQPLACAKATRLLCRDRLLAHLADLHLVLEIRDQGNLLQVLRDQQRHRPKRQWVLEVLENSASCRGNEVLLGEFPQWGSVYSLGDDPAVHVMPGHSPVPAQRQIERGDPTALALYHHLRTHNAVALRPSVRAGIKLAPTSLFVPRCSGGVHPRPPSSAEITHSTTLPRTLLQGSIKSADAALFKGELEDNAGDRYLYHYTRPCPGPWPGQSYRDYLNSLVEGEASCGHNALDTLERILREGRIRGSHRLVRGVEAVISWTSRPPRDLTEMRRWNRGLMRWTFEPYGVAVNSRELRRLGAKPAVYGRAQLYQELPPAERYRFQLLGSKGMSWKLEKEWRLLGDLALHENVDAFVFVPEEADAEQLIRQGSVAFPIVVLTHEKPSN